jgi:hypothetical protein
MIPAARLYYGVTKRKDDHTRLGHDLLNLPNNLNLPLKDIL